MGQFYEIFSCVSHQLRFLNLTQGVMPDGFHLVRDADQLTLTI